MLTAGWLADWRIRGLTELAWRRIGSVLDGAERVAALDAALRDLTAARSAQPRSAPPRPARRLRFLAIGLTAVNAAAVIPILALPGGTATTATTAQIGVALLLGVALAGGQTGFAVALGRRLQEARCVEMQLSGRRVGPSVPAEAIALALLSTLVGWVVFLWVRTRLPDAQLGVLAGMVLGVQAWVAPWLLVAESAAARLSESRRIDVADRRIGEFARHREIDRSLTVLALVGARSAVHRAERIADRHAALSGRPGRASWEYALRQLRDAVAEAEAGCADLTVDLTAAPRVGDDLRPAPQTDAGRPR